LIRIALMVSVSSPPSATLEQLRVVEGPEAAHLLYALSR
jgi:hypothetical protein